MPLPTQSEVLTLDYTGYAQPAAYIEAKTLTSASTTLDYTLQAQPVFGLADGGPTPPTPSGSSGLYSGTSGLALGTGLYRDTTGLWGGFSGLKD